MDKYTKIPRKCEQCGVVFPGFFCENYCDDCNQSFVFSFQSFHPGESKPSKSTMSSAKIDTLPEFSRTAADPGIRKGFVYLIDDGTGLYKIGFSINPKKRLESIQSTRKDKTLVMLRCIFTRNQVALERRLHKLYADKREHLEWFRLDQSDVRYIISIPDDPWDEYDVIQFAADRMAH